MDLAEFLARVRARDGLGEHAGGGDRRLGALGDDGAGDAPRRALFAVEIEDIGERLGFELIDQVGGAAPGALHAHVERAVEAEGKAALRLVELHGGHADVEHDAVKGCEIVFARRRLHA